MKKTLLSGSAASAVVATLMMAAPAYAAPVGTQVGESIDNTVAVSFKIGTIDQEEIEAEDNVAVDRLVDFTLVRSDDIGTVVSPGETNKAVTFVLTNNSNDELDFGLNADEVAEATASDFATGENDSFDTEGSFTYYVDDPLNGTQGVYDVEDDLVTSIDDLPSGDSVTIHVVTDVNTVDVDDSDRVLTSDDRAIVSLTAEARDDTGSAFTEARSNSVDATVVDTVFGDADGDGQEADTDDYFILAAGLSATKSSSIVEGAFAGDNSGTYLPGAVIQYCILVTNSAGSATASDVEISDILPNEVAYFSDNMGVEVGGDDCDADDSDTVTAGTESSGTVSGTIGSLAAGETVAVIFEAKID